VLGKRALDLRFEVKVAPTGLYDTLHLTKLEKPVAFFSKRSPIAGFDDVIVLKQ